jgi:sugar phosphate isomerase/epimerase
MKIFAQTFTLDPQTPLETVSLANEHGFQGVEITCEYPRGPLDYSDEDVLQLAKSAREFSLPLQVHAPYHNVRITDGNPRMQEASIQSVKDGIDFAHRIDARIVTMHLGSAVKILLSRSYLRVHKTLLDAIATLIEYAEARNIIVGIENVPPMKSPWEQAIGEKAEEIIGIIKEVKAKNVGITFDIGHANVMGDPIAFATKSAPYTVNVHVHDNDGRSDQHLVVGKGTIDFPKILSILKDAGYSGPLVLEYFDPESLIKAKIELTKLLKRSEPES